MKIFSLMLLLLCCALSIYGMFLCAEGGYAWNYTRWKQNLTVIQQEYQAGIGLEIPINASLSYRVMAGYHVAEDAYLSGSTVLRGYSASGISLGFSWLTPVGKRFRLGATMTGGAWYAQYVRTPQAFFFIRSDASADAEVSFDKAIPWNVRISIPVAVIFRRDIEQQLSAGISLSINLPLGTEHEARN